MNGLSELHARRAADTASLCRELSRDIRLPTIMQYGKFAASVGTKGTVFFYEYDGFSEYRAQFDVAPDGAISWTNNDIANSPSALASKIDAYLALTFLRHGFVAGNPFRHSCSISCLLEHG